MFAYLEALPPNRALRVCGAGGRGPEAVICFASRAFGDFEIFLIMVRGAIGVFMAVALRNNFSVYQRVIRKKYIAEETAVFVTVALRWIAFKTDLVIFEKVLSKRRCFFAKTLYRFARINGLGGVDADEAYFFVRIVDIGYDCVAVDDAGDSNEIC